LLLVLLLVLVLVLLLVLVLVLLLVLLLPGLLLSGETRAEAFNLAKQICVEMGQYFQVGVSEVALQQDTSSRSRRLAASRRWMNEWGKTSGLT
jgi:hypothetical protein